MSNAEQAAALQLPSSGAFNPTALGTGPRARIEKDRTKWDVPITSPERYTQGDRARFFQKIDKKEDGCWLWTGGRGKKRPRYGRLFISASESRYVYVGAHRVSYILHRGAIPDGMQVCHTCDNPACVNPAHLFLGSDLDNHLDAVRKGRKSLDAIRLLAAPCAPKGETHPNNKLTTAQVLEINSSTEPCSTLARRYGITRRSVVDIHLGISWSHTTGRPKIPHWNMRNRVQERARG